MAAAGGATDYCSFFGIACADGSGTVTDMLLDYNGLSGTLPLSMGALTSLVVLAMGGNRLSGELPVSMGSLSALESLSLSDNQLAGALPAVLLRLPSFAQLFLANSGLCSNGALAVQLADGALPTCTGFHR